MAVLKTDKPLTGLIRNIQRMSTEDGPGIRTTVFFKGCPLACGWCHNPECIPTRPQVQWVGGNCIGCGLCVEECLHTALCIDEQGVSIDRSLCDGCGTCAAQCPSGAMQFLGTAWDYEALIAELVKDRAYFEASGGGITLSGGEATMQPEFCRALLRGLKMEGIQTALHTCGHLSRPIFEGLLPFVDILLFDVKEMDRDNHRRFTGRGNTSILDNLLFAGTYARTRGRFQQFWVRTPLIPGATARPENIRAIGEFIARHLNGIIDRWELFAFNNLCRDKYQRLGLTWEYARSPLLSRAQMSSFAAVARASGVNPAIVSWSGTTLGEEENRRQMP